MKRWDRRSLIAGSIAVAGAAGCGISVTYLASSSKKNLLRPPGALEEKRFLASCIKCGQCIQVCPFHSLKLLDLSAGIDMGTPVIDPLRRGCYLCDLFPCILCCPSGALDPQVQEISDVHMGIAWVNDIEKCWAKKNKRVSKRVLENIVEHGNKTELEQEFNQKLLKQTDTVCRLCEQLCPIPEKDRPLAIRIENGTPLIGTKCVGCGVCAEVCPETIIEIKARRNFNDLYNNQTAKRRGLS